ncbi:MAG: hypothetical protein KDJ75_04440 [Alphaproteobacteria bacterium]|nr:hypothetical protein [Alphaproteobacteria bacterium]
MADAKLGNLDQLVDRIVQHSKERNHFSDFRKERLGPVIDIQSESDFKRHIYDTLNAPETKGFIAKENGSKMYFYNERTNTFLVLDAEAGHGGTMFRRKNGEAYFIKQLKETSELQGKAPKVIHGGLEPLMKHFAKTTSAWAKVGRFFGKGAQFLGDLSKILGPVGIAAAGAEAYRLLDKAKESIENGLLDKDALLAYEGVLALHTAQATADPTLLGGEVAVQLAYNEWVEKYAVPEYLIKELEPSSLVEMVTGEIALRKHTLNSLPSIIEPDMPEPVQRLIHAQTQYAGLSPDDDDPLAPSFVTISPEELEAQVNAQYFALQESGEIEAVTAYLEKEALFEALPVKTADAPDMPPEAEALIAAKAVMHKLRAERFGGPEQNPAEKIDNQQRINAAKDFFNARYEELAESGGLDAVRAYTQELERQKAEHTGPDHRSVISSEQKLAETGPETKPQNIYGYGAPVV